MTKDDTSPSRSRETLMTSVDEPEQLARKRYGITIERSSDLLEEVQTASQRALTVCSLGCRFNQLPNTRAVLRRESGAMGVWEVVGRAA